MLPYWIMFLIPALGALSRFNLNLNSQRVMWAGVWLLFTLMVGLRHQVGADWVTYERHLEWRGMMPFTDVLTGGDPGYYLINWLVAHAGGSIHWVNLVCGMIIMTGVVRFCRHQPAPWVALAAAVPYLIIVVGMGYSRQAAAIGFVLIGLVSLSKGRVGWFVFLVLLGAAFHKSAVLMIPIAALASTSNRAWSLVWVGVMSLVGAYLFVFDSADQLWDVYVVQESYESQGGLIRVIMNAIPAVIYLIFKNRLQLTLAEKRLWFWLSLLALVCIPLVILSSTATDRVALYLIPLQLFVFSRLYRLARTNFGRTFIVIGVLGYYGAVQAVWLFFSSHAFTWLPYQIVWFSPAVY